MRVAVWLPLFVLLVAYPLVSYTAIDNRWAASWVFYVPPLLIYFGLLTVFSLTLRPGHEPLIARFARLEQGTLSPELIRYTRCLTMIWCAFFAAMLMTSLGLAVWASVSLWSLFTHLISYLLLAVLIVGEYSFRRWRFPHYRHANLWQLIQNIRASPLR